MLNLFVKWGKLTWNWCSTRHSGCQNHPQDWKKHGSV